MKRRRNCTQLKRQEKTPEKINNETNNLPDKEFKALVIKMLTKLGKRIDVHVKILTKN